MIVSEMIDEDREAAIDAMRLKCFRNNDRNDRESLLNMLVKWFGERTDRRMDADIAARKEGGAEWPRRT